MEKWKEIKGYEGQYEVSDTGKVRSLNYNHTGKQKELKIVSQTNGYCVVNLGSNKTIKSVHRLVAEAFLPNPDNLPEIDHIIPISCGGTNCVENLRWCSHKGNMNNAISKNNNSTSKKGRVFSDEHKKNLSNACKGRIITDDAINKIKQKLTNRDDLSKPVYQYTLDNELVKIWSSASECNRNGFSQGNISACCRGERKTHKGYKWSYFPL